jgi:hypothetical protein
MSTCETLQVTLDSANRPAHKKTQWFSGCHDKKVHVPRSYHVIIDNVHNVNTELPGTSKTLVDYSILPHMMDSGSALP